MNPIISPLRLNLLRVAYLIIAVGLALTIWPVIVSHSLEWPLMNSVVASMLTALSLLALLGLRYPLQMLPLLLFEFLWKTIWLVAVARPLWSAGALEPRTMETVRDCLFVVLLLPLIPWRHVIDHYVRRPGERWRTGPAPTPAAASTHP